MMKILEYSGKKIYYLDMSNYSTENLAEMERNMNEVKRLINKEPPKSALLITNVTGVNFNTKMTELFKEYAEHNTPYVKASSLIGVSGLQKIILTTIKKFTGRDFHLANTLEDAEEWLIAQ